MSDSLRQRLEKLFRSPNFRPLNKSELARKLELPSKDRAELRALLKEMERAGAIVSGKKGRFATRRTEADLLVGTLRVHPRGHAFFAPDPDDESNRASGRDLDALSRVFVPARSKSTALHGDRVAVSLRKTVTEKPRRGHRGKVEPVDDERAGLEGRVEKVLERKTSSIVAALHVRGQFRYAVPEDGRFPPSIELNPSPLDDKASPGELIVVGLDEWSSPDKLPRGHIAKVLGPRDAPGVDILAIIHQHHLPMEFPVAVRDEAASVPEHVLEEETVRREDWREREVFTIDPADARDFDDAICITTLPEGGWELAVHIADVSHYVKPGSALDKEARHRGNSVYLVDRVIPMLPENLSNGICSLRPEVDRLTRAVIMTFDPNGKPVATRFAAAVIHSVARFSYEEAYALLRPALEGGAPSPPLVMDSDGVPRKRGGGEAPPSTQAPGASSHPLAPALARAWELAYRLRQRRFHEGALELDMPEVKVVLDDRGVPVDLIRVEYDESHQLIEEFMLAANEAVARAIRTRGFPSVYRIHEDPDEDRLFEFRELARLHGYEIGDLSRQGEIQKLLRMVHGQPEERLIKIGLLKSLKRAAYHADPIGHYGLAKIDYTHFTSPIRRYADLIVHRVLGNYMIAHPGGEEPTFDEKTAIPSYAGLLEISKHISDTERSAAAAEEESRRLKELEYFARLAQDDSDRTFTGLVLEVARLGVFVELAEFFVRGLVRREDLPPNADWFLDLQTQRVVGRRPARTISAGDTVEVRVINVDLEKQFIDFEMV